MGKRILSCAACALFLTIGVAQAQERATLLLRSGERVAGDLVDLAGAGFLIRVNGQDRTIATNDVAVVDFAGDGQNFPASELSKLSGSNQMIVLRSGETINGQLTDIGGAHPLRVTINVNNESRDLTSNDVARVYLSRPPSSPTTAVTAPTTGVTTGPQEIVVSGREAWTPTGIFVQRAQTVVFSASGEVQLGGEANVATPAGSKSGARPSAGAPLPGALTGALIGRVGNGRPFLIGGQTQIRMPAAGQLFLGINDDHAGDNTGEFRVTVNPQSRR